MYDGLIVVLILIGIAIGLAALVLPIVATVLAVKASRRIRSLQVRLDDVEAALGRGHPPGPETPREAAPALEPAPTTVARPEPVPEPVSATPPEPVPAARTLEERIGLTWFTRVGVVLVLLGLGFFFKYLSDNDYIGPWGRLGVGALAGIGFLIAGEVLARRKRTHPVFAQGLLGLGLAALLVSAYASHAYYDRVPVGLAFGAVALLCVLGGALAALHRAQSVLVLSLLAVFLNPVLLSTGVDRPLALFAYLWVMTGAALAVAARLSFRWALGLAVAGVVALVCGWYARFFDPSGPRSWIDLPPEQTIGAYHALASRWAPLLFAILFPAQWIAAGAWLRRRSRPRTGGALIISAALFAHIACAALLFDHELLLGAVLCLLALAVAVLFLWQGLMDWLGLPMLAAFGILLALQTPEAAGRRAALLGLGGVLAVVYFGALLRRVVARVWRLGWLMLVVLFACGAGLTALALISMCPDHPLVVGMILVVLSGVYLALASRVGSAALAVVAFLGATGTMIGLQQFRPEAADAPFLGVSAVWALVVLGSVCLDLFVRNAPITLGRMFVLGGAGLAWGALLLLRTNPADGALRALLALPAGIVYLGVGLRMARIGGNGPRQALAPFGLALMFFTLAVFFMFSGATVTVLWAAEGALLCFLAASGRRRAWLAAAAVLLLLAVVRALAIDLQWPADQLDRFLASRGREGMIAPAAFANPRALAFFGLGLALLLSARLLAKVRPDRWFRGCALGCALAGHAAGLVFFIAEIRLLFTEIPLFPASLAGSEEFDAWWWEQAGPLLQDQETRLGMVATVVLGVYAAALLLAGFVRRDRLHRLAGIGLFAVTLGKLCFWDVWHLPHVYQIVVLVVVGLLLLCGAFLYARFSQRIKELFMARGVFPWALLMLGLAAPDASAADIGAYRTSFDVGGVEAAGDYRLSVGPELYRESRTENALRDLRLIGPDGVEVPFFIRVAAAVEAERWTAVPVLDPVKLPDGSSRAILDTGAVAGRHDAVELDIEGTDYLRATRVESGAEGEGFGVLAEGAYVYQVSRAEAAAGRRRIAYPPTETRRLRVTLLPGADGQPLPIRAARVRTVRTRPGLPAMRAFPLALEPEPAPAEAKGQRRYVVGPLPPGLPLAAVRLDVSDTAFVRRVALESSTHRQAWSWAGEGVVFRVQSPGPSGFRDESLEVPFQRSRDALLRLIVFNGDDPPLQIRGVEGLFEERELIFRANRSGPHSLLIGREDDPGPRYDLEDLVARGGGGDLRPARLGAASPNPAYGPASAPPPTIPWTERHARLIQVAVGAAVLALGLWTVLLIRRLGRKSGENDPHGG